VIAARPAAKMIQLSRKLLSLSRSEVVEKKMYLASQAARPQGGPPRLQECLTIAGRAIQTNYSHATAREVDA